MHWPQLSMAVWLGLLVCASIARLAGPAAGPPMLIDPVMQRRAAIGFLVGALVEAATLYAGGFWS